MESSNRKFYAQKGNPQSAVPSPANRGWTRNSPPQPPLTRTHSISGIFQRSPIRESTQPLEFRLHTQQRAAQRAIFNSSVATKMCIIKQYKKQVEKVLKVLEEEEVRTLRREMVPRAQLMPLFDKPFLPQRSSRPLTIPREPSFRKQCSHISCR